LLKKDQIKSGLAPTHLSGPHIAPPDKLVCLYITLSCFDFQKHIGYWWRAILQTNLRPPRILLAPQSNP